MQLRCIGGRSDGMIIKIPDHAMYRKGEAIRVPAYQRSLAEVDLRPDVIMPEIAHADYFVYIVDVLKYNFPGKNNYKEIWFLRPENFTTFDAIQFQFNK